MLKNKAISLLGIILGCGQAEKDIQQPWEQVQGCWSVLLSQQQSRERLILQLVLAEEEPDITALKYSKLSEAERVLVAKWRIERERNPDHPRWSGIVDRIVILSDTILCIEPTTVVFKNIDHEERLKVEVHEQREGHVQLSHEENIWDLWWSTSMEMDFSRTGLAPIHLKRVVD